VLVRPRAASGNHNSMFNPPRPAGICVHLRNLRWADEWVDEQKREQGWNGARWAPPR